MKVGEIRQTQSRSTQGVGLINLAEGDRVRTVEYMDVSKQNEADGE